MDGAVFFLLGLYMNRLQFYLGGKLLSGQCRKFTIFPPCVCCREQFVGHAQLPYRFPFFFQLIHIATNSFQMFPDKGFVRTTGLQVFTALLPDKFDGLIQTFNLSTGRDRGHFPKSLVLLHSFFKRVKGRPCSNLYIKISIIGFRLFLSHISLNAV